MIQSKIHNAGFYLESLWRIRHDLSRRAGFNVGEVVQTLSTFNLRTYQRRQDFDSDISQITKQVISVYEDLLRRGLPTFPSLMVENALLQELVEHGLAEQANDSAICFDLSQKIVDEKWENALLRAHVIVDSRITSTDIDSGNFEDSDCERDFFHNLVPQVLGQGLSQFFAPQVPFTNLVPTKISNEFSQQRVDFALNVPDLQIIFEIDGPEHNTQKQKHLDTKRDDVLNRYGWCVLRIKVCDLNRLSTQTMLTELIKTNSFAQNANKNHKKPLWQDKQGKLALQAVLAPFGIARLQLVLLQALAASVISIDQQHWSFIIIERDVKCALLALLDFQEHLLALFLLAKSEAKLPRIELVLFTTPEFSSIPANVDATSLNQNRIQVKELVYGKDVLPSDYHADVLIDLAILQKFEYKASPADQIYAHQAAYDIAYEIRSVYTAQDDRRITQTEPLAYASDEHSKPILEFFLQNLFRKPTFRPGQFEIVKRTLALQPVIGLLPTGAGKSICYQLSALLQPGMTIIVDPLISLIEDQVDNLQNSYAIDWLASISSSGGTEVRNSETEWMAIGKRKLLFLAPERLQSKTFRMKLREFSIGYLTTYLVIDEAHCVSEWGHDFRTSYLRMTDTVREYCRYKDYTPTIIALTGTASHAVLSDVQREIGVDDAEAQIYPESFDRKELTYRVVEIPAISKKLQLLKLVQNSVPQEQGIHWSNLYVPRGEKSKAGIIFTPHANGEYGAKNISFELSNKLNAPVKYFTGQDDAQEKTQTQTSFKNNEFTLLVATKAFGMGIDKPNIRYTVHYNIPPSLEAFYQEAGRAGRDRKSATCWLIFSDDNANQSDQILAPDAEFSVLNKDDQRGNSDVNRLLWFHKNSFQGVEAEFDEIKGIYQDHFGPALLKTKAQTVIEVIVPFKGEQQRRDKALYRLSILKLVQDYTLDYSKSVFEVTISAQNDEQLIKNIQEYMRRYKTREAVDALPSQVLIEKGETVLAKCVRYLLRFVYDEIEKKRRAAIRSIVEVARKASTLTDPIEQAQYIREELVAYLEKSPFTDKLLQLVQRIDCDEWFLVLKMHNETGVLLLSTVDGIRQLIGGCRRTLESHLEHPGLLFLSSIGRFLLQTPDTSQAFSETRRAFKALSELSIFKQTKMITKLLLEGYQPVLQSLIDGEQLYQTVACIVLEEYPIRSIAHLLHPTIPNQCEQVLLNQHLLNLQMLNAKLNSI